MLKKELKDKMIISSSIILIACGVVLYNYLVASNDAYAIISLITMCLLACGLFAVTAQGKSAIEFISGVKSDFGKIHFPKLKEVFNGLGVVLIFCVFFTTLISIFDMFFLKWYNSLM